VGADPYRQHMSGRGLLVGVFVLSVGSALVAYWAEFRVVGNWIVAPAVLLSGWLTFGHLVTIDDDLPGEWSNPQGSRAYWYRSLLVLTAKLLTFGALVWWVLAEQ
jgi:hypothetical protein